VRFSWEDYLKLAHELAEAPQGDPLAEARWRSAVSRAYFAAYHAVRAYAAERRITTRERRTIGGGEVHEGAHGKLINALLNSTWPEAPLIGHELSKLRGLRSQADYVPRSLGREQACFAIDRAQRLICDARNWRR